MSQITVTLPDGSNRAVPVGTSVGDVATRSARRRSSTFWHSWIGRGEYLPTLLRKGNELPIAINMDKTGIASTQESFHFLDRLCDHAARLVGLKLVLQLNENLIGAI